MATRPPPGRWWAGVYDADGLWDLSGPITARRTLGDVVADLLVDEIVDRAGVPSLLADQARELVHDLVAAKVKAAVDQSAPAALRPDSELMRKLAVVLASTEVKSTIDIAAGRRATDVRGTEELRSFTFGWEARKSTVMVGDSAATDGSPGDGGSRLEGRGETRRHARDRAARFRAATR